MMINKDLRLRRVDNKNFIVAVGEKSKSFSGMVKLNDTAAMIFELLKKGLSAEEIAKKLEKDYDISLEKAVSDVENTIEAFKKAGFFL